MPVLDVGPSSSLTVDACTPIWCSVESLIAAEEDASYEDAEEAIIEATWVLNSLTLHRFHGYECRIDEYQSRPGLCRIRLARTPVDVVHEVTRIDGCSGEETEAEGWCYIPGGTVRVCCRGTGGSSTLYGVTSGTPLLPGVCGCDDGVIRISYRTAPNLPPGAARVCRKLALEFWKSGAGRPCSLPERITSVTRQDVTWITLDPLDFLDKGLTGIGSVDQWITAANQRGVVDLIDPLVSPRLLTTVVDGCTEDCGESVEVFAEPAEGEG